MRPLGETQQRMLESMREHHGWASVSSSWVWQNPSTHIKILESLERRGLVAQNGAGRWRLTDEGLAETQPWQDARDARARARAERHAAESTERDARAAMLAELVDRLNTALGLDIEAPSWGGGLMLSIAALEAIVTRLEERS